MGVFSKVTKKREELAIVFDINSSSVGGALFYMQRDGVPKIIYSTKEAIELEEEINIDRFLFLTNKALKTVVGKICMKGLGVPTRIFCVVDSPWYASQTRIIKLSKNTPFVFTDKLADSLIQKEISLFEEEHKIKDTNNPNRVRPIELKNMKTMLNGYATSNPYNQKATDLEMTIFISMIKEDIARQIEETIHRHFKVSEVKFTSFVMASFTVARDMFVNQENFLLINIGGEITDISMIKKDILRESISFPKGSNFIIRGVAKGLNCSLSEATAYVSLFKDGHIEESVFMKLDPIVTKLKNEWLKDFQASLSNLTNDISIPATIFITVEQEFVDFFSRIIKTEQFNQYTLTESKFRVIFLGIQALHGIALVNENVERDPFLIIESIYINRFLG